MSRDIWSYWEGERPPILDVCEASWRKYAVGWNIHLLNPESLLKHNLTLPSTFKDLTPQSKSDCIRISLLEKYGGLWMDGSIELHRNLDWLLDFVKKNNIQDFTGFQFVGRMENWLMYVPFANNKYIKMYREEVFDVMEHHPYYKNARAYEIGDKTEMPTYFMMFQAYFYLLHTNKDFAEAVDRNRLMRGGIKCILTGLDFNDSRPLTKYTSYSRNTSKTFAAVIILLTLFLFLLFFGEGPVFIIVIFAAIFYVFGVVIANILKGWAPNLGLVGSPR